MQSCRIPSIHKKTSSVIKLLPKYFFGIPTPQIDDLTLCLRFKLPVLGGSDIDRSRVVSIEDRREEEGQTYDGLFSLFHLNVAFPKNFFGFGFPKVKGSYKSYLMQVRFRGIRLFLCTRTS